jgi:predicted nucleic acid-binding protein
MIEQRLSIDTNILVYSVDKDAGARHEQSRKLVDALADSDCVLTVQALAEFFHP